MGSETEAKTMKAVCQDVYGTPDVLELREIPRPLPAADRVVVKVAASSVNAMEWHMTTGLPMIARPSIGFRTPKNKTPGADIAGVVVEVGRDVDDFKPGDEVFGEVGAGTWAQYAIGSTRTLVHKPANLSFEQAGAVGVAGLTALQGLRNHGHVAPGHDVLIIGASGGVGTYAVQIAKAMGANVTAVCSTRNIDQARELGADAVIDYREQSYANADLTYDAVIDIVGTGSVLGIKRILKPGGRYIVISGPKRKWVGPIPRMIRTAAAFALSNKKMKVFVAGVNTEDLETLGQMLATGEIRTVIEGRYDLADAHVALAYLGEGHARGKNVILVS